jgi:HAMP domain-containing protein
MTATGTTTTETLSSPPPARPSRGVVTAAGLAALAAVALIPWLLTTSPLTETSPITPTLAATSPDQAVPALGEASRGWNASSVDSPAEYVMFCQFSPVLCAPPATPALPITGYIQLCWNSPTLCMVPKRNSTPQIDNSPDRRNPFSARGDTDVQ